MSGFTGWSVDEYGGNRLAFKARQAVAGAPWCDDLIIAREDRIGPAYIGPEAHAALVELVTQPDPRGDIDELEARRKQAHEYGLPPLGVKFRRPWTPHTRTLTGLQVHVKRACNGCGQKIGDVTNDETFDAVEGRELRDVTEECPHCTPEPS